MVRLRIGCSGWSYPWWKGTFYPEGLAPREQLSFYSRHFSTVEVNMTFYRTPSPRAVATWYSSTPEHFVFAVKMSRRVTHYRKLRDSEREVRSFVTVLRGLGEKLGPILVQLPPDLGPDLRLLEDFLAALPPHRYAVEFRDRRWLQPLTYRLLEQYDVALVHTDPPPPEDLLITTDFTYVRWHGRGGPGYEYSAGELEEWAHALENAGVDRVYGFFNNDQGGAAPRSATALLGIIEGRQEAAMVRQTAR